MKNAVTLAIFPLSPLHHRHCPTWPKTYRARRSPLKILDTWKTCYKKFNLKNFEKFNYATHTHTPLPHTPTYPTPTMNHAYDPYTQKPHSSNNSPSTSLQHQIAIILTTSTPNDTFPLPTQNFLHLLNPHSRCQPCRPQALSS